MGKAPAFQFYPKDFISDTAYMTPEQAGVYIRLLCYAWVGIPGCELGYLPSVASKLARLGGISKTKFEKIKSDILSCFVEKNGFIFHKRLLEEREKQKDFNKKQKENADSRWHSGIDLALPNECQTVCQTDALQSSSSSSSYLDSKEYNITTSVAPIQKNESEPPLKNPVQKKSKRAKAKIPRPENFELTPAMEEFAKTRGIENPEFEFEAFKNHHDSKGSVFANWEAAWRTWVGRSNQFKPQKLMETSNGKTKLNSPLNDKVRKILEFGKQDKSGNLFEGDGGTSIPFSESSDSGSDDCMESNVEGFD